MSRLSRNILYNVVGQGLFLLIGFAAVRLVFRQLGADALGILYFALTLSMLLAAALDLGVGSTTVREVSAHLGREPAYIVDLVRTASLLYWGAYVVLALALWLGADTLARDWINLASLDEETAARALQVLGAGALLGLPRSLYVSFLRGLERMEFPNAIDVGTALVQQAGVFAIVLWGGGILAVARWLAVTYGLCVVVYVATCARFIPRRALLPGYSRAVVQRNLRFSLHMMSISVFAVIHTQADKLLISRLLPLGTLGFYNVAYNSVARAPVVNGAITQAVYPRFAALAAGGDRAALREQFERVQDLMGVAALPLVAAVPFFALPFFTLLFDHEIASRLLVPVALLAVGFYMNSALSVPYVLSLAVGRPDISARCNLLALVTVLPLTAGLIYAVELPGAGLAWIAYHVFGWWYAIPRVLAAALGVTAGKWYSHALRLLGLGALAYGLAWWAAGWSGGRPLEALAVSYVAASAIFVAGAYLTCGSAFRATVRHGLGRRGVAGWIAPSACQATRDA